MDYDKLIERLRNAAGGPEGIRMCQDAATAIETLGGVLCAAINHPDRIIRKPRWTEQDKEDARKIKAMLPAGVALEMVRLEPGTLRLVIVDELSFVSLNKNLLPSLKPGESAMLDEIIGGGE